MVDFFVKLQNYKFQLTFKCGGYLHSGWGEEGGDIENKLNNNFLKLKSFLDDKFL